MASRKGPLHIKHTGFSFRGTFVAHRGKTPKNRAAGIIDRTGSLPFSSTKRVTNCKSISYTLIFLNQKTPEPYPKTSLTPSKRHFPIFRTAKIHPKIVALFTPCLHQIKIHVYTRNSIGNPIINGFQTF